MEKDEIQLLPDVISKAIKLPGVKVDRREFLLKTFNKLDNQRLDALLNNGTDFVLTDDEMIKAAKRTVLNDTEKSTAFSFATGLPSNPFVAAGTGTIDIMQFFGFSLRMAQEIAYIFGRYDIFDDQGLLSDDGKRDVMLYMGSMLGVAAANSGLILVTKGLGQTAGKKIMQKAVTKTVWYPLIKKIGSAIGVQVTKKTTSSLLTKTIPIVGGIASGGLTFLTFRPMGNRLVRAFSDSLHSNDKDIEKAEKIIATVQ